jgi:hypothetical protein
VAVEQPVEPKPVVKDPQLTLKQLSQKYLIPVGKLRADVRLNLGGGIGPNPHGLKHTEGNVYKAPIPVPIKRPALDLESSKE